MRKKTIKKKQSKELIKAYKNKKEDIAINREWENTSIHHGEY